MLVVCLQLEYNYIIVTKLFLRQNYFEELSHKTIFPNPSLIRINARWHKYLTIVSMQNNIAFAWTTVKLVAKRYQCHDQLFLYYTTTYISQMQPVRIDRNWKRMSNYPTKQILFR